MQVGVFICTLKLYLSHAKPRPLLNSRQIPPHGEHAHSFLACKRHLLVPLATLLGITMIFPTLLVAVLICWRTRQYVSELTHNLAVIFWICANSYWMITEFFAFDETSKFYALIPFGLGLTTLFYYYVIYAPRSRRFEEVSAPASEF